MLSLVDRRGRLSDLLFDLGAVRFGQFRLKHHETNPDAPLSPIYLNLRTADNPKPGPLTPEALGLIGDLLAQLIEEHALLFSYLCGIPRAGEPFATALIEALPAERRVPLLHLGKEETAEKRRITGLVDRSYEPHAPVLLLDDLITQAASKLEAIRALEEDGLIVHDLLILVDREQGGSETLRRAGYAVHAALTLSEILNHYVATGRLSPDDAARVRDYVAHNS